MLVHHVKKIQFYENQLAEKPTNDKELTRKLAALRKRVELVFVPSTDYHAVYESKSGKRAAILKNGNVELIRDSDKMGWFRAFGILFCLMVLARIARDAGAWGEAPSFAEADYLTVTSFLVAIVAFATYAYLYPLAIKKSRRTQVIVYGIIFLLSMGVINSLI